MGHDHHTGNQSDGLGLTGQKGEHSQLFRGLIGVRSRENAGLGVGVGRMDLIGQDNMVRKHHYRKA